MPGSNVTK